ncbi:hypothetical protein WH47_00474 [Habropoda laboriosa]|uniref:Histone-lysine N-methyltransferase SETMAR n=1 Tax=Habropoda laboriosa TaxID=597456 RepID=A0A0L7R7M8_9HYME|nr:hypothetical protein WH47_00474 [Habropoda laboriosa]
MRITPLTWHHHSADAQFKTLEDVRKCLDEYIASKSPSFYRDRTRNSPENFYFTNKIGRKLFLRLMSISQVTVATKFER